MMIRKEMILVLCCTALLVGGCQIVNVKTPDGKPVMFAEVNTQTSHGESGFPAYTGLFGEAMLPVSNQPAGDPEWLLVTKDGFAVEKMSRPSDGVVNVTLHPTGGMPQPPRGGNEK
jgi:hypothetical protein